MSLFMAAVGFGLVTSAVLAAAAVGFTMQFAVTDVLNLAFGAVMIICAFIAYWLSAAGVNVWVGVAAGTAAGALLSIALNSWVYSPFRRKGTGSVAMVIVALGMLLVLEFGLQAFVGGDSVSYPSTGQTTFDFGGIRLTGSQVVIIVLAVASMAIVHFLLRYTRLGKAMRATAADRSLARTSGIRTDRVVTTTWAISGALSGLAGCIFAMDSGSFGATSADLFLVLILAAVFLGGPGSAYGAMLGALVIGMTTEISAAYITPAYKDVVAFALLLVMLAWRPSGLLTRR